MGHSLLRLERNGVGMQETIRNLVNLDREARKRVEEIQRSISKQKDQILQNKDAVYQDYLEKAKKRIDKMREEAQQQAEKQEEQVRLKFEASNRRLDEYYQQHKDGWIEEIVRRCIRL